MEFGIEISTGSSRSQHPIGNVTAKKLCFVKTVANWNLGTLSKITYLIQCIVTKHSPSWLSAAAQQE